MSPCPTSQKQKSFPKRSQKLIGICYVCGDKSSSHSHYGSKVCFSCRAFFRRLVRKGKMPDKSSCNKLSIEGIGQCPIIGITRQLCRFCRYQKCISVGMDANLVMSKDEIVEWHEKAKDVRDTGISSGKLAPTSYALRVKSYNKHKQNDLSQVLDLPEIENQKTDESEEFLPAKDQDILIDFICSEDDNAELKVKDMQKGLSELIELSDSTSKLNNTCPCDDFLKDQKTDDSEEYKDHIDILIDICNEDINNANMNVL